MGKWGEDKIMNLTSKIAQFIYERKFGDLLEQTVEKAKLAFWDELGGPLAGSAHESSALTLSPYPRMDWRQNSVNLFVP
jgi:hypothetical protein